MNAHEYLHKANREVRLDGHYLWGVYEFACLSCETGECAWVAECEPRWGVEDLLGAAGFPTDPQRYLAKTEAEVRYWLTSQHHAAARAIAG